MSMKTFLNPRVYLEIAVGGRAVGRMNIELYHDKLPITSENFRALCTGETGLGYWMRPRWYRNTHMYRVIPGLCCQGGDFNFNNGNMGESIYGQLFRDEGFSYMHSKRGLLSMAKGNHRHTCNSNFFFTFDELPHLDGEHVVFGQVIEGMHVLDEIEKVGSVGGQVKRKVEIWECGEYDRSKDAEVFKVEKERPRLNADMKDPYCPIPQDVWRKSRKLQVPNIVPFDMGSGAHL